MLLTEYPVLPQTFQHMYLAVVRARLGETAAIENEWQRALEKADSTQNLLALADYAEKNDSLETAEAAYARAITKQPGLRSAYVARLRLLEAMGQTVQAHNVAAEMSRVWPGDLSTHIHDIYLRLLLGDSEVDARSAEREAEVLVSKNPWDGVACSTLALARLKQGRAASALEALSDPKTNLPPSAISWPVYAAALAANGWKDKARAEAQKLTTVRLLPEERALIAPLIEK
jgi:tetratricopeptide (TPR) repeat protein